MKVIDLTLEITDGISTFPGLQKAVCLPHVTHSFSAPRYAEPCKGFASFQLLLNDHTGTHVDAPFHMIADGDTVEKTKIENFVGKAIILDFSDLPCKKDITAADIMDKENELMIQEDDIVIIRKWNKKWGEDGFFECKALTEDAAEYLVNKKIKLLGIDLPTVDVEESPMRRAAHIKLLSNNIYIVENLVNLDQVTVSEFEFIALPLNIEGISGSPVRAAALIR